MRYTLQASCEGTEKAPQANSAFFTLAKARAKREIVFSQLPKFFKESDVHEHT